MLTKVILAHTLWNLSGEHKVEIWKIKKERLASIAVKPKNKSKRPCQCHHCRCRPLLFHPSQLNPIPIHAAATASQLYYIFGFLFFTICLWVYLVIADVFKDIRTPIGTKWHERKPSLLARTRTSGTIVDPKDQCQLLTRCNKWCDGPTIDNSYYLLIVISFGSKQVQLIK